MQMSGWPTRSSQQQPAVPPAVHHQPEHFYPAYPPHLRDYPYSQQTHQPTTASAASPTADGHHHASQASCMCCPPRPTLPYQQPQHQPQHQQQGYAEYHPSAMTSEVASDRHTTNNNIEDRSNDYFPQDPREWSDVDVSKWLMWASRRYGISNTYPERFQMNGKALCLMDLSMFVYRVPDGGDLLYQDFQSRLQHVLYDDRPR